MTTDGLSTIESQERTTNEILSVLAGFETNSKYLVTKLEQSSGQGLGLLAMEHDDWGALLAPMTGITDRGCLERLVGPLKEIETHLTRAGALKRKAGPEARRVEFLVAAKLLPIRTYLKQATYYLQGADGGHPSQRKGWHFRR